MYCMYVVLYAYGCVVHVCECVQLYVVFVHIVYLGSVCMWGHAVCLGMCVHVISVCLGLRFGKMELLLP